MLSDSERSVSRWLKNKLDVRLGAQLWALELELPRSQRRAWKFTILARTVGRLYYAGILKMPEPEVEPDAEAWTVSVLAPIPEEPRPRRVMCLTRQLEAEGHALDGSSVECKPCQSTVCCYVGPVCGCDAPDCIDQASVNNT